VAPTWKEIRAEAARVLEKHRARPKVAADVVVLLNSMGDTLSNERVTEELKALGESGTQFVEVIATIKKTPRPSS
jgi:hypothetical protein